MSEPAGCISEAQEVLRRTLADCPRWREFCAAPGRAAARARIHHEKLPDPASGGIYTTAELASYRPYAIVSTAETGGLVRSYESTGASAHFDTAGVLWLLIGTGIDSTLSVQEQDRQFKNLIGTLIDELCDLCGRADVEEYLFFRRIRLAMGPFRFDEANNPAQGEEIAAMIDVEWGAGQ